METRALKRKGSIGDSLGVVEASCSSIWLCYYMVGSSIEKLV